MIASFWVLIILMSGTGKEAEAIYFTSEEACLAAEQWVDSNWANAACFDGAAK